MQVVVVLGTIWVVNHVLKSIDEIVLAGTFGLKRRIRVLPLAYISTQSL
jgi:hypothetical protein